MTARLHKLNTRQPSAMTVSHRVAQEATDQVAAMFNMDAHVAAGWVRRAAVVREAGLIGPKAIAKRLREMADEFDGGDAA